MRKFKQTLFGITIGIVLFSCGKEDVNPIQEVETPPQDISVIDDDMTVYYEDNLDMSVYADDPYMDNLDNKKEADNLSLKLSSYTTFSGRAKDIGVGSDGSIGSVWIVGYGDGNRAVYKLEGEWKKYPGYGVKIAVGHNGKPWLVSEAGTIYRMSVSGTWVKYPGRANDIGVGEDGSVWIVGYGSGNRSVYKWGNNKWVKYPGMAQHIDVDEYGNPWVVTDASTIFRWDPDHLSFVKVTGTGWDIAIKESGDFYKRWHLAQAYIAQSKIYRWTGSSWTKYSGIGGYAISAGNKYVWTLDGGTIRRHTD